jgi:hypothetical protein
MVRKGADPSNPGSHESAPSATKTTTPPPAYAMNPDLVISKRLNHAMDEIRDLQRQLEALKTDFAESRSSLQSEISSTKRTLSTVLRKEGMRARNKALGPAEPYQVPRRTPLPECERSRLNIEISKQSEAQNSVDIQGHTPTSPAMDTQPRLVAGSLITCLFSVRNLGPLVAGVVLRVVFFGCLTDLCIRVLAPPYLLGSAGLLAFIKSSA